jgi:hypothetical protein
VFSPQDYELAARILGLPVPTTPAERAVAAPMTATVLRNFYKAAPPMPGREQEGLHTSPTRSLNGYPANTQPEARVQLGRRLQAGVVNESDEQEIEELIMLILNDPNVMAMFMEFLENLNSDSLESGEYLSQQRPLEYDLPNYGGQYSVLNAPSNSTIPASVQYQELG